MQCGCQYQHWRNCIWITIKYQSFIWEPSTACLTSEFSTCTGTNCSYSMPTCLPDCLNHRCWEVVFNRYVWQCLEIHLSILWMTSKDMHGALKQLSWYTGPNISSGMNNRKIGGNAGSTLGRWATLRNVFPDEYVLLLPPCALDVPSVLSLRWGSQDPRQRPHPTLAIIKKCSFFGRWNFIDQAQTEHAQMKSMQIKSLHSFPRWSRWSNQTREDGLRSLGKEKETRFVGGWHQERCASLTNNHARHCLSRPCVLTCAEEPSPAFEHFHNGSCRQ